MSYFAGIDPIRYEGPESTKPLAFHWYERDRLTPYDPAFEEKMAKADEIVERYRNTLPNSQSESG